MIVWSGWGLLVIVITVVVGGGVTLLLEAALQAAGLARWGGTGPFLGLAAAAATTWVIGRRLNGQPGREMIDKATGQIFVLRRRHTLFWIPVEWWAVPLGLFALFMLVAVVASGFRPSAAGNLG